MKNKEVLRGVKQGIIFLFLVIGCLTLKAEYNDVDKDINLQSQSITASHHNGGSEQVVYNILVPAGTVAHVSVSGTMSSSETCSRRSAYLIFSSDGESERHNFGSADGATFAATFTETSQVALYVTASPGQWMRDDSYWNATLGRIVTKITYVTWTAYSCQLQYKLTVKYEKAQAPVYVAFNASGGACSISSKQYSIGSTLGGLPTATKSGYVLDGWYTSDGDKVSPSTVVKGDMTLYAHWTVNPTPTAYTVTYAPGAYGNGSQQTAAKTQGTALTLKGATFARTGYAQTGWSKNSSGSTKDYNLSASYTTDAAVTLYPYWTANTYKITYALNSGAHGSTHPASATYDTAFYVSAPTRSGYTFAGWTVTSGLNTSTAKWGTSSSPATAVSGASTKCVNGAIGNVYFRNLASVSGGNVTLTANWTIVPITYTVIFNTIGGTCSTSSKAYSSGSTLGTLPTATWAGFSFDGWYLSSGDKVSPSTVVTGDMTLYAHWNAYWIPNSSAPANDNFANAMSISGASGSTTGSNVGATRESEEAAHGENGATNSIWWKWTAPSSGRVTFTTEGSSFDTGIAVYTGNSIGELDLIDGNGDVTSGTLWSSATFEAASGVTYRIAVAGYNSKEGSVKLNWNMATVTTLPDLRPYTPDGWSGPIDISAVSSTHSTSFVDSDTIYVVWAVECRDVSISYSFKVALYVDGELKAELPSSSHTTVQNILYYGSYTIGGLSAGSHTVKIVVDSGSEVVESDESNNAYSTAFAVSTATLDSYVLTYAPGAYGAGSSWVVMKPYGAALTLKGSTFTRAGYTQTGWSMSASGATKDYDLWSSYKINKAITLYPYWTPLNYNIVYKLNGGVNLAKNPKTYTIEDAVTLAAPTRNGYTFTGWTPDGGKIARGSTGDKTFTATWKAVPTSVKVTMPDGTVKEVTPGSSITLPAGEPKGGSRFVGWSDGKKTYPAGSKYTIPSTPVKFVAVYETLWLYDESAAKITGEAPYAKAAAVYDGYVADANGNVKGSVQVKVAKGKVDKKTGAFSAKVTATVQLADGTKKLSFKGGFADASGGVTEMSAAGHTLDVSLGVNGLGGSFDGKQIIDGTRNVFTAKDADSKALAAAIEKQWVGSVSVIGDGISLGVSIAKKGKVKISGTVNGVKVSASSQLLVGEEDCCVPVVIAKKANLAFNLWLMADGSVGLAGRDDVIAGPAGTLKAGSKFRLEDGGAACASVLSGLLDAYLPDGVSVLSNGKKWIVAPDANGKAAKAGKVVIDKATGEVNEAKAGANPSALKLTYKVKDGSFKGSFKAYTLENGKVKSYSFTVTGVLVNGVGYGTATLKKPALSIPITIE